MAIGERFTIILNDGRVVEADTWRNIQHSAEATPTKYRVSSGVKPIDHTVLEPKTTQITALYSDTPLDATIAPGGPFRAQRVYQWLQQAMDDRNPVQVYAGLRYYPAAIISSLSADESFATAGTLVASITVQEFRTAQSLVVKVRTVKRKSSHKKKIQTGQKEAEKIAAVQAGANPNLLNP